MVCSLAFCNGEFALTNARNVNFLIFLLWSLYFYPLRVILNFRALINVSPVSFETWYNVKCHVPCCALQQINCDAVTYCLQSCKLQRYYALRYHVACNPVNCNAVTLCHASVLYGKKNLTKFLRRPPRYQHARSTRTWTLSSSTVSEWSFRLVVFIVWRYQHRGRSDRPY